jgi:hypothetical protein
MMILFTARSSALSSLGCFVSFSSALLKSSTSTIPALSRNPSTYSKLSSLCGSESDGEEFFDAIDAGEIEVEDFNNAEENLGVGRWVATECGYRGKLVCRLVCFIHRLGNPGFSLTNLKILTML